MASAVTDAKGAFRIEKVAPGRYDVRATLTGFKTTLQTIEVPRSGVVTLSIALLAGSMNEEMAVTAGAPPPATQMSRTADAKGAGRAGVGGALAARQAMTVMEMPVDATRYRHAPPNTESYARIDRNPFKRTADDPLSTFAADVDTASYANVRRFLNSGQLPPVDAVRVEELVNYFHFQYPDPRDGRPVSITTEVGDAPWAPSHKLVLVGVKARPIDQTGVGGRNIVLLIDVSGSMSSPDKLPLVKTGLRMFVDTLRDDDRLAIVVYAGASGLALPSTPARHRVKIHDALEALNAGGSTNGGQGLTLAYKVAEEQFVKGGINRVILATDGDFNVGITGQNDLLTLIEDKKKSGIFLSVLGVGTGNLKDSTMEMLADKGNGHYAYLDTLQEARRVLVREGGATLDTVAKDVKFQVEFNPAKVAAWRLIGYENRLLAHQDFNDDKKDGGELGAGHTVTVLYEIVPAGTTLPDELLPADGRPVVDDLVYQTGRRPAGSSADLLTVKVRYKEPHGETSALMTESVRAGGPVRVLPFAAAVAEFGMLLTDARSAPERWTALTERLERLPLTVEDAADRQGFQELVDLAAGLKRLAGSAKERDR